MKRTFKKWKGKLERWNGAFRIVEERYWCFVDANTKGAV